MTLAGHGTVATLVALACVALVLSSPRTASADGGLLKVAVPDLKLQAGVPPELAEPLALTLAQELERLGPFKTVSSRDIREMIAFEKDRSLLGCDTASCLAEIGGALGVDWMASGTVSRLGDTYVLQLQLIRLDKAKVVGRASREHRGDAQGLLAEIRVAAVVLVREVLEGLAGELMVRASEEGASIRVDGAIVGVTPLERPLTVTAGPHTISVERDGFIVFRRDVSIVPRSLAEVSADLQPSMEFLEAYDEKVASSRMSAYLVGGAGIVALAAATVTYFVAGDRARTLAEDFDAYNESAVRSNAKADELDARQKELATLDALTIGAGVVGAIGAGTGAWLLFTGPDPDRYEREAPPTSTVGIMPQARGLTLSAAF